MNNRSTCPFCHVEKAVLNHALACALFDKFPASRGHLLVLPRRHVADCFELTPAEREAVWSLAEQGHALLQREFAPDGFNLGVNVGQAAGQTIFHAHLHLIPRYRGDVPDPRGGVRAVISRNPA